MTAPTELFAIGIDGSRSVYVRNADGSWPTVPTRIERPATSQEGEEVPPMPECDSRQLWSDDEPNGYLESDRDWSERNGEAVTWLADNHAAIRSALAATPTPPTLSEDLRDFALVGIERIMREGIHDNDGPNRIWIDGVAHEGPVADFTIRTFRKVGETARAALAQVKAS